MVPLSGFIQAPVKSAWSSKTNWIAGLGGIVTCLISYAPTILPLIPAPYGTIAAALFTIFGTVWARTTSTAVLSPAVK
jgi:hypothetical protein